MLGIRAYVLRGSWGVCAFAALAVDNDARSMSDQNAADSGAIFVWKLHRSQP